MDAKQRQDLVDKYNELIKQGDEAKSLSNEAQAAIAFSEAAKIAAELARSPIPLSGDPTEIIKAVEKFSPENRLKAHGLENDPEMRRLLGLPPVVSPMEGVKGKSTNASKFASPIILDLDGDGVETIESIAGAYFDHAADGFAERTGWVARDDGLLAWDRNGNGMIDSGRELFGSEALLANGAKAANGFEALKSLDANNDGAIDANDPAYTELRVWKDTDGNGRSDAGEMLTLIEAGVQGIDTAYTNSSYIDAYGNVHKQVGSFTTTDGETRAVADVWFKTDATYSLATSSAEVSEEVLQLPDAQGYGKVRDLHQAMAMDDTGQLKVLVTAFTLATTQGERLALVRQIIYRWTGVQDIHPASRTNSGWGNAIGDARKLEALEEFLGEEWWQYSWGANPGRDAASTLSEAYEELVTLVYGQLMAQSHQNVLFQQIAYRWDEELVGLVGDLSGVANTLRTWIEAGREAGLTALRDFLHSLKGMGLLESLDVAGFQSALLSLGAEVAHVVDTSLAGWDGRDAPTEGNDVLRGTDVGDVLNGWGGNDRLYGRGGDDTLIGDVGNDALDGEAGNDGLRGGIGSDTYRFGRGDGHDTIIEDSWQRGQSDRIELKGGIAPDDVRLERVRTVNGWQVDDGLRLTIRDTGETLTVKNHFNASDRYAVEEIVFADGTVWDAETITSRSLLGDAGNDELLGFNGRADVIEGGAGKDRLQGLSGDDTLDGVAGDDVLEGGEGSDTYRFGLNGGQDVINENATPGQDVVELGAGIAPAGVLVRWTVQGNMAVTLPDGSRLTVRSQASPWSTTPGIEQLRFADGTVWSRADLAARALAAIGGDDAIVGGYQDDILDGGAGNDSFQDLGGNDTYRFGIGDGQDVIEDTAGRVLFKPGVDQNGVDFARDGNDLIATIAASGDAVRIKDWLNSWQRINYFDFDNGARLSVSNVLANLNMSEGAEIFYGSPGNDTLSGTEKNSTLYGDEGDDVLAGGAGQDTVFGEAGNDTLDGGPDRDSLYGGEGNNIYIVTPGSGLDTVNAAGVGEADDTVLFAPGVLPEDVTVQLGEASGSSGPDDVGHYDVVVGIGGNDALVLRSESWQDVGRSAIQHFRFADGTEWTLADLIARADGGRHGWQERYNGESATILGSQGDDWIYDYTGDSVVVQARGNDDYVELAVGNDIVSAGSGNDEVESGGGDDLVAGEGGDDSLDVGAGDDVIMFNHGDGRDSITAGDGVDSLSFGATVTPAMLSAALDRDGCLVLLVDGGAGGMLTLQGTNSSNMSGDLERMQFVNADGATRVFDLAGWLQANTAVLSGATMEAPLAFDGAGFELTGSVAPAGGLEAVAYAQSGDLFAAASLANNTPTDGGDVLYGTPAGDTLDAGAGNDIVLGVAGGDAIFGGEGNDLVHGGEGHDVLEGGDGDDVLYGGWGADTLSGGTGRDELFGEWNGDTYSYQPGDGEVIIDDDHSVLNWSDGGEGGGEGGYGGTIVDDAPNTLSFGPGIRPEDLRYSEQNGDLVIEFAGHPGDRVVLRGYEPSRATQTRSVDIIRFADGAEIVAESIEPTGKTEMAGDAGGWLNGSQFADTLIGGEGDDVLEGNGGADRLVGGAGSDTYRIHKEWDSQPVETLIAETWREQDFNRIELTGELNPDDLRLEFDGRDLLLRLNEDGDVIRFAGFDPRAPGMRAPVAEISLPWWGVTVSFDDLLAQGVRYGDHIQDIYEVNIGDGDVVIDDIAAPDAGNVLRFGPGIDPNLLRDNLRFEEDGSGGHVLCVSYGEESDVVRLSGFNPDDVLGGGHAVERFEFVDGTAWDYATLISKGFTVVGDDSSNYLVGSQLNDRIVGYDEDDVLTGKDGYNEFYGGSGNDTLIGGDQVDGYFFQLDDGVDTIIDGANDNFIVFGPGIIKSDIEIGWDAGTLILRYGPGDEIRIPEFIAKTVSGTPPVTAIKFDDGEMVSIPTLISGSEAVQLNAGELPAATEDTMYRHSISLANFDQNEVFGKTCLLNLRQADGSALPDWLAFDAERGLLLGIPSNEDVGQLDLIVEAWGDYSLLATQQLSLSIDNTNDAPEAGTVLADQQATEDAPFAFTVPDDAFFDVDAGDALTFSATRADGSALPAWLSFDAATRTFSGLPANGDVGSVSLTLTATDLAGAQASQTFGVRVVNVNDAPEIGAPLANRTIQAGNPVNLQLPEGAFVDVDAGDVLGYSASLADGSALPDWLAFDPATGSFSGTPAVAGTHSVRVTATDLAGAQVSQSFTLDVVSGGGNQAPVTALDTATVIEDRKLLAWGNVLANDSDPEGGSLRVADVGIRRGEYGVLTLLPNGTYAYVLNDCSEKVQCLGAGETVVDRFSYLASDGTDRTSGELAVAVQGTNDAPDLARCLQDVQLAKGKAFSWQVPADSFTDGDRNDTLAYTASLSNGKPLPSWLTFDAATQTFSGTAPANAKGSIDLRVTASDGHGECSAASDIFKISFGNKTVVPTAPKGNEGVGNGPDAPPPGHDSNLNDGPGTSPGQPGCRQGSEHDDDPLGRFLDGFKTDANPAHAGLAALDRNWFAQLEDCQRAFEQPGQSHGNNDFQRHWSDLAHALEQLDAERQGTPAWCHPNQGADLSGLAGLMQGGEHAARGVDAISLTCGSGTQLKAFSGLHEGVGKLSG